MQHKVSEHVNKRGGEGRTSVIVPPGGKRVEEWVNINARKDERLLSGSLVSRLQAIIKALIRYLMPFRTSSNGTTCTVTLVW